MAKIPAKVTCDMCGKILNYPWDKFGFKVKKKFLYRNEFQGHFTQWDKVDLCSECEDIIINICKHPEMLKAINEYSEKMMNEN